MSLKIFVLCFLCVLTTAEHPTTCPSGYKQMDDHCFLYLSESMTFFEAVTACDVVDGKLVQIVSQVEQDRVQIFMDSVMAEIRGSNVWMGATDLQGEGNWLYLSHDFTDAISQWNSWAPSYPKTDGGSNCAAMNLANKWRWQDNPCDYHLPALCEVRLRTNA